jgi:hypothetical protein
MINGNLDPFVAKVLDYHKNKSIRSYRDYNENAFHSVIEVFLNSFSFIYISELQLIMNYNENVKNNKINYGFVDIFIFDNINSYDSVVFELKLFNLIGLYSGERGKWEVHPAHSSLIEFDNKLQVESEEVLLERNYIYWSKEENKSKSIKVSKVIKSGYEQLINYIKVINKGKAYNKVGISDDRISVQTGCSLIKGYLIASFGTQRILVKSIFKSSNFQFFKIKF